MDRGVEAPKTATARKFKRKMVLRAIIKSFACRLVYCKVGQSAKKICQVVSIALQDFVFQSIEGFSMIYIYIMYQGYIT
jgi:hypothetical protein